MAYVALGRSIELKDICIKGKVDPEALAETIRLQYIFDKRLEEIATKKEEFWKVSYLNVKSLKCHKEDIMIDNFITSADLFVPGET